MSKDRPYRQILRSSYVIGSASVVNILLGVVRMKVAAVVLGPAGVGLIGLLQQLMVTASSIASMGMSGAGTRQIALTTTQEGAESAADARRALVWASVVLALSGGGGLWLFRVPLAEFALNDPTKGYMVGWLALGVALSVAAVSQVALLNGLRQIGDLARINIFAALLSTLAGVPAILFWGDKGILALIIAVPLANFAMGHFYVARLPKITKHPVVIPALKEQWQKLFKLGSAFMIAGVAVVVGQLVARSLVQRELGVEELGHFTAAWTISMTYIGFVLGAMSTDYYPRLTAVIHDRDATNRLVNEQTEVALLLAGPVLLAMMTFAPWVIELLYSKAFMPAVDILRWQILGDILKVVSWPLGFIILAAANGRTFMLTESLTAIVFLGFIWLTIPSLGLDSTGVAFLVMYVLYLPTVYWLAWKKTGFLWRRSILRLALGLVLACVVIFLLSHFWRPIGFIFGLVLMIVFSVLSFLKISGRLDVFKDK